MGGDRLSTVLLIGANGFLGTQVARRLLRRDDCRIIAMVRAKDRQSARQRLLRSWWDWPELVQSLDTVTEVTHGDITMRNFGLTQAEYESLVGSVTHIIHTAADLRLNAPIRELRKSNVEGTGTVLRFAREVKADHGLSRLAHVSTAYVAGARTGKIAEDSLSDEEGFNSNYELSKYEGEILVKASRPELPVSVFRPGMVVGDSLTGEIKTFNTLYFPLRLYLTSRSRFLPLHPSLRVNMVPVDYVSEAIARLTFYPRAEGLNFHLTAPESSQPTLREFVEFVRNWAVERMNLRLPRPFFLPIPHSKEGRVRASGPSANETRSEDSFAVLRPYFYERREYQRDNIDGLLGPYDLKWQEFLPKLLDFAVYMGFMHKSERTVHEQMLFRLSGRRRPVTFFDVVQGKALEKGAGEMRRDIVRAASALSKLGVGKGDRVALVGRNSTRYLTVDVAIGLAGAVSVPLYYTSPPSEIDEIVSASGSLVLFVGDPRILGKMDELSAGPRIVSMCAEEGSDSPPKEIIRWKDFLEMGDIGEDGFASPAGFGDLATIRYTSGTTGRPRGVTFRHDQLRYMAESLASLPPWEARNSEVRYLSFLPMNHVVEGILGTYSPYYAPAPLKLYFLEDFRDLQKALPIARPSIFFSVPRFYEKVWEGFSESGAGRSYLASKGTKRKIMRWFVRRSLLKRIGLDSCRQLIAGSAPSSEQILQGFRELGIEIHNAYGLTEAPLVTLNRLGRNRLGTVGEPLPKTEVKAGPEGDILVKGPQVTTGYFGKEESPFEDGWLVTGDVGYVTGEGSLVVTGRRKEIIKTSYGKLIHPMKAEAMLRDIPGVTEAMLVGDNRPFCIAFIWVDELHKDMSSFEAIDRAVSEANERLSNPERPKRWAVMAYDLAIEKGDLTANLKLKRREIGRRLQGIESFLYAGEEKPEAMLHVGEVKEE